MTMHRTNKVKAARSLGLSTSLALRDLSLAITLPPISQQGRRAR
jgi:hypothetical protein